MKDQIIVALGRESGSGGLEIARELAARLDLPLYERNMLERIAREQRFDLAELARYDELPRKLVISRRVNGFSNAPEDSVADMQFRYMRRQADSGASFVVVGRCAEEVLRDYPGLISIFVLADEDFKKRRTMAQEGLSEQDALAQMARTDRRRRAYHDQFSPRAWGMAATYDLTVNSARLGIAGTVALLEQYIRARVARSASL